nr:TetR/AcrR family transcriptional regulator [Mycolicibacterium hippocampi]
MLEVAAQLFAERPYDDVSMEDVAARGGVSRALLYRHFPSKPKLFAAMYQQAADRLLHETAFDAGVPLAHQIKIGLDAHFDYFEANRYTVLAANRTLAGDPTIQAVINGELEALRSRMVSAAGLDDPTHQIVSTILMSWLVFVRVMSVDWLANNAVSRVQLRDICVGALLGALENTVDVTQPHTDTD